LIAEIDDLQFIDVRVKYTIYKADARALVRVLVWEFNMYFPKASGKWRWKVSAHPYVTIEGTDALSSGPLKRT